MGERTTENVSSVQRYSVQINTSTHCIVLFVNNYCNNINNNNNKNTVQ